MKRTEHDVPPDEYEEEHENHAMILPYSRSIYRAAREKMMKSKIADASRTDSVWEGQNRL